LGEDEEMASKHIVGYSLAISLTIAASAASQTVVLKDIDSGLTSPQGNYRWLDAADQAYSGNYRTNYNYTKAAVVVGLDTSAQPVSGVLLATNLKPNFTYQLKLVGTAGTPANERIGRAGRYWQEVWDGTTWANGWNLNNKGEGYFPTPNDTEYFANRDVADPTSPTGRKYKHTCYLVFDYFITDPNGNATLNFQINSSYHVLFKTSQQARDSRDGPAKRASFDPAASDPAYGTDYPSRVVDIFGEWERLPTGAIQLLPGEYRSQVILTEESFHGSGGQYAGGWAAAMGGDLTFSVAPRCKGVSVAGNAVSLEIADCYVGITNYVERCLALGQGSGWQKVFTFVSTSPGTNWSETVNGRGQAFYRIASQVSP
jgi:hypothetical protein